MAVLGGVGLDVQARHIPQRHAVVMPLGTALLAGLRIALEPPWDVGMDHAEVPIRQAVQQAYRPIRGRLPYLAISIASARW